MPAVTMVAAWMSAETGVGPSMASGSQTWRGNWADLPKAPSMMQKGMYLSMGPKVARNWVSCEFGEDGGEFDAAEVGVDEEDADGEAEVADAVGDEGFFGGGDCGGARVVVADEEVGGESDAFPAEVEEDEVIAHDEEGHEEDEDGEVGEESPVAVVTFHVAGGVDEDEEADAGDEGEVEGGELVDGDGDGDVEVADGEPVEEGYVGELFGDVDGAIADADEEGEGDGGGAEHGEDGGDVGEALEFGAEESDEDTCRERERGDEPGVVGGEIEHGGLREIGN